MGLRNNNWAAKHYYYRAKCISTNTPIPLQIYPALTVTRGGAQAGYLGAEGGATARTGCQFMAGDKQPFSLAAWNAVASDAIVFPDSEIAAAQQQLVRKSPGM